MNVYNFNFTIGLLGDISVDIELVNGIVNLHITGNLKAPYIMSRFHDPRCLLQVLGFMNPYHGLGDFGAQNHSGFQTFQHYASHLGMKQKTCYPLVLSNMALENPLSMELYS